MTIEIYHNPRCSKSRASLALLRENGIEPQVRLYLEDPPDAARLRSILDLLGLPARALLRTGEKEYAELGLADESLSEAQLIAALVAHPRLLERPIVISGARAVIGRPPENVLSLL